MAKVKNGLTDSDPRFHISFNSAIGEVKGKFSRVIFDTGAEMHVMNTSKFMANTYNDNSYKVYGVGGKEKASATTKVGDILIRLKAWTWASLCVRDTGRTRMPSNQGAQTSHNVGQLRQNRDFDFATTPQPALHHTSAPCVLDTTNQL